jgi:ATP-binding protein involved in chromosome partitioning
MSDIQSSLATLLQNILSDVFPDTQLTAGYIVTEGKTVNLNLPFVCNSLLGAKGKFSHHLESFATTHQVKIKLSYHIPSIKGQNPKVVKNVIAVASGIGGVGKSTTSINLAAALKQEGARVGISDADVYGPSIPTLLGTKAEQPGSPDNKRMYPIPINDIQTMSIGYLVDEDSATIWRGPMASKAFQQLYNETVWDELDYLIVDMPPDTGDIQLTLAQNMPVSAAIVVTTPQDLALADAINGIAMFNKVNINVLGIVENMSYHLCTELLAQLPLNIQIHELADSGSQFMLSEQANSDIQKIYRNLARKISHKLSQQEMQDQQLMVSIVN